MERFMRRFLTCLAMLVLAGCGTAPFLQPGDEVRGELTGEQAENGSLFVSLTLDRLRAESRKPIPFGCAMGKAWPEGRAEFLDPAGNPLGDKRTIQFEDGC
jgi:hypothetical protein